MFEDIGVDYHDGLFTFFTQDQCSAPEDLPMGIYDIKTQRVLFDTILFLNIFKKAEERVIMTTVMRNDAFSHNRSGI